VAHVALDDAGVDAGFEQVGGVAVAKGVNRYAALVMPAEARASRKAPWTLSMAIGRVAEGRLACRGEAGKSRRGLRWVRQ